MKFAVLSYTGTINLGDEIQSIAARRLLGRADLYFDRDDLAHAPVPDGERVAMIVHGWFGHSAENWPPHPHIEPLLVSLHISASRGLGVSGLSASQFMLGPDLLGYLKTHAPIGARDLATLDLLTAHGVGAYFSGCLTLTLEGSGDPRGEHIVLNDLPDDMPGIVRGWTDRPIVTTTHADLHTRDVDARFARAERLLRLYETAHCVITSRLHCALPCLAFGTPVLFLTMTADPSRLTGLDRLFRCCTVERFREGRSGFDVERSPVNRDDYRPFARELRATVAAFLKKFYEADERLASDTREKHREISAESRVATLAQLYRTKCDEIAVLKRENADLKTENANLKTKLTQSGISGIMQRVSWLVSRRASNKAGSSGIGSRS